MDLNEHSTVQHSDGTVEIELKIQLWQIDASKISVSSNSQKNTFLVLSHQNIPVLVGVSCVSVSRGQWIVKFMKFNKGYLVHMNRGLFD